MPASRQREGVGCILTIMREVPRLDQVVTVKMSRAMLRRCKRAARKKGEKFAVWCRQGLVALANGVVAGGAGVRRGARLDAPVLPR